MIKVQTESKDEGIRLAGCLTLALADMVERESQHVFTDEELIEVVEWARRTYIKRPWKSEAEPIIIPGRVGKDRDAMRLTDPDALLEELAERAKAPFIVRQIGQKENGKAIEYWGWVTEKDRPEEYWMRCFLTIHGGTHWKSLRPTDEAVLYDGFPGLALPAVKKTTFYKLFPRR